MLGRIVPQLPIALLRDMGNHEGHGMWHWIKYDLGSAVANAFYALEIEEMEGEVAEEEEVEEMGDWSDSSTLLDSDE